MFRRTTAINKLRKLKKRKRVVQGGTSAGKTFGILPILIDEACKNPLLEISVVSATIPHLRRGAIKDFLKIMVATKRYIDSHWNRTLLTYTFSNGSYIEFFSAEQEDKLRGARRNVLYINEANNISFEAYHQLAIRTSGNIWLDFNPTAEFWAHTEVLKEADSEQIILTYKDNEALSQTIIDDIESAREKAKTSKHWENWWNVYGLGLMGEYKGGVFNNLKTYKDEHDSPNIVAYIDVSDEGTDYTAMAVARIIGKEIQIIDVVYSNANTDITIPLCEQMLKKHNVKVCRVESNNMGAMFGRELAKRCKATKIFPHVSTTNKMTRIRMNSYFVLDYFYFKTIDKRDTMYREFISACTVFKLDGDNKNDDAPDCITGLAELIQIINKHEYV